MSNEIESGLQDASVENVEAGATPEDRLFKQDEVDNIRRETAKNSFQSGYDKASKELQKRQQKEAAIAQSGSSQHEVGGDNADVVRELVEQELVRRRQEEQRNAEQQAQKEQEEQLARSLQSVLNKAHEARERLPDYDDVTGAVDWEKALPVLLYSDQFDNGGDMLYHLAKNPSQMADLLYKTPEGATDDLRRLSESLSINHNATVSPRAPEPVGRMSAPIAGVNDGQLSFKEKRAKYTV